MLKLAIHNLTSRSARSLLSVMGLTLAIMGMVGLYSIAGGIDRLITDTFSRIPGVTVLQNGAPIPLFSRIPSSWGKVLGKLPEVHVVCGEVWGRANLIEGKMVLSPPRFYFGTDIAARNQLTRAVYRDNLVSGRFLDESDRGEDNIVISRLIAKEHGKQVGDRLEVDGHSMRIVGIYHCGSVLLDVAIVLDIDRVRESIHMAKDQVSSYYIEPRPGVSEERLTVAIREELKDEPGIAESSNPEVLPSLGSGLFPGGNTISNAINVLITAYRKKSSGLRSGPLFEVRGSEQWREGIEDLSSDLEVFLFLMTSLGVTIALLSILNTMLMSVSERYVEFGILKANGWSSRDVVKLIVLESSLLGILGGVCGSGLGWIGTHVVNVLYSDRTQLYASPRLLCFSLMFSLFLGVLGGAYPSWRASRMSPMEAIRRS